MRKYITNSNDETIKFGVCVGERLLGSEIICLKGDLGTGKTTLVKGIAKALGISEHITSPTFILVNEYYGSKDLYHFDVYRIHEVEDVTQAGFFDYLDRDGIKIIEWADLIEDIIPRDAVWIEILKDDTNEDARTFLTELNIDY